MIKQIIAPTLAIILIFGVGTSAFSQDNEEIQSLPEYSIEQNFERLQFNFHAFAVAIIKYAKQNGESAADAGVFLGELYAPSWADSLTAEGFLNSMNANWQMIGIKTKVIESSPDKVKGKRTLDFNEEEFDNIYGQYGVSLDEHTSFFNAVIKAICNEKGLTYSETLEGDKVMFTIETTM